MARSANCYDNDLGETDSLIKVCAMASGAWAPTVFGRRITKREGGTRTVIRDRRRPWQDGPLVKGAEAREERRASSPRSKIQGGAPGARRSNALFVVALVACLIGACSPAESVTSFESAPPGAHEQAASEEQGRRQDSAGITPPGHREQAATPKQPEVRGGRGVNRSQNAASSAATGSGGHIPTEVNVYSKTMTAKVDESVAAVPERVYVPNVADGTVVVIDPATFEVVDQYAVGEDPYHVTPSWDMRRLYVNNEASSSLTKVDPETGKPTGFVSVPYPYNLYFTPDGKKAIVVVERLQTLEFRDPNTWRLLGSVYVPYPGVDHIDFSANGDYLLASSEWSGVVTKVDTREMKLVDYVEVGGLPIDVKLSPDGSVFYVANQGRMGVSVIDPVAMEEVGFIPTGAGAHGLQISRDATSLYVSNRLEGTISVIDLSTREVVDTWVTGGTPDMFQLSSDGTQLWVSGRYDGAVYVVDTRSGALLATVYTGFEPHGLCYFPNPGRFSLGHNGVYR
jgi:YVTN family beta-propeller protein